MSKLTTITEYRKNGTKNIKGYRVALQKVACEENGFNENSEVEIEYIKNKIVIKAKESD